VLDERIVELISTLGIKKNLFANAIGFSQAYVSMVLHGKRQAPSERFLDSICREFHVCKEWLITGEGEIFDTTDEIMPAADLVLLKKYKRLPVSEQKIVNKIIDAFLIKAMVEIENKQHDVSEFI